MKTRHKAFRILIADDERPILQAYEQIFTEEDDDDLGRLEAELFGSPERGLKLPGFDVSYCQQGEEAVAAVRQACLQGNPFAVAFLDMRMPPGIDGVEVAKRIRSLDPEINIVVVTGFSDLHPKEIARQVPPLEKLYYIAKPFQAMEIQQIAMALTSKWGAEHALVQAHEELQERFGDLQIAYREMSLLKEQAELANRAKTEFLARMSHELRTPLNAIIGFSEIMKDHSLGPQVAANYQGYSSDIHASGHHLLNLINDILDLSKIEAGKLDLDCECLDLPQLFDWVGRLMGPRARDNGLTFEVRLAAGIPEVHSDRRRLAQVLINLLGNAVKFTPDGGTVGLEASFDETGALRFTVTDNGIGIAAADLARVQKPFEQAESGHDRKYQGTGLGLPLAKSLTEQLGGSFAMNSTPGQGTTVTVTLPIGNPSSTEGSPRADAVKETRSGAAVG